MTPEGFGFLRATRAFEVKPSFTGPDMADFVSIDRFQNIGGDMVINAAKLFDHYRGNVQTPSFQHQRHNCQSCG